MRLNSFCLTLALLLFVSALAAMAGSPSGTSAVGAPTENYTVPDIPTDDPANDEIKPHVNFSLQGPTLQGKSTPPSFIASFSAASAQEKYKVTADDKWYLDIDVNSPGWLYIYEYYPKGSNPDGKWIAYKWRLTESGLWKLGPFSPGNTEPEGQHIYRTLFYGNGQWAAEDPKEQRNYAIFWTYSKSYPELKILSFEVYPPGINSGEDTLLSWDVQGSSAIEISDIGTVAGPGGTWLIKPPSTATYTLTARDPGGKVLSQSATVTVRPAAFLDQALKFPGNPLILIILGLAAGALIVLLGLTLRRRYARPTATESPPSSPPALLEQPDAPATPRAYLALPNGLEIQLAGSKNIGRGELARALGLDELCLISRQHFRITCTDGQHFIEDMGGGGTSLNGTDIRHQGEVSLNDGDLIELAGTVKLKFHTR
jgi:hypothetical protein